MTIENLRTLELRTLEQNNKAIKYNFDQDHDLTVIYSLVCACVDQTLLVVINTV